MDLWWSIKLRKVRVLNKVHNIFILLNLTLFENLKFFTPRNTRYSFSLGNHSFLFLLRSLTVQLNFIHDAHHISKFMTFHVHSFESSMKRRWVMRWKWDESHIMGDKARRNVWMMNPFVFIIFWLSVFFGISLM